MPISDEQLAANCANAAKSTQAERHYRRAVEEFDRLKALRAELPNEPILEVQPEEKETAYAPPDEPISTPQPSPEPPANSSTSEDSAVAAHPSGSASDPAQMATPIAGGESPAYRCTARSTGRTSTRKGAAADASEKTPPVHGSMVYQEP